MPDLVEFVDDLVAEGSMVTADTEYLEILLTPGVSVSEVEIQDYIELPDSWISVRTAASDLQFSMQGNLQVKIGDGKYPAHTGTWKVSAISAMVGTAPTGSAVMVDINKNGSSIFTTPADRVTIAAGQTVATVGAWNDLTFTSGDWISVDVDQVGSTTPGVTLTVSILLERTT